MCAHAQVLVCFHSKWLLEGRRKMTKRREEGVDRRRKTKQKRSRRSMKRRKMWTTVRGRREMQGRMIQRRR